MQDHANSPRLQFGFIFVGLARRWRRALDERMAEFVDGCMSDKDRDRFVAEQHAHMQVA